MPVLPSGLIHIDNQAANNKLNLLNFALHFTLFFLIFLLYNLIFMCFFICYRLRNFFFFYEGWQPFTSTFLPFFMFFFFLPACSISPVRSNIVCQHYYAHVLFLCSRNSSGVTVNFMICLDLRGQKYTSWQSLWQLTGSLWSVLESFCVWPLDPWTCLSKLCFMTQWRGLWLYSGIFSLPLSVVFLFSIHTHTSENSTQSTNSVVVWVSQLPKKLSKSYKD